MSTSQRLSDRLLEGRSALVVEGSRGIRAAISRYLAAEGANVAISYGASPERAEMLVRELEAHGVRAVALKAEQGDPELVQEVVAHFGRLDILVNSAGVFMMNGCGDSAVELALNRDRAVAVGGVLAAVREAARA
jgi:3-oxoacyl-[acyl-carrier protein] reductase